MHIRPRVTPRYNTVRLPPITLSSQQFTVSPSPTKLPYKPSSHYRSDPYLSSHRPTLELRSPTQPLHQPFRQHNMSRHPVLFAFVLILPLVLAQTDVEEQFDALDAPMPCAMLTVYTTRPLTQRDEAMTAACCAIAARQAARISVRIPEPCLDLASEEEEPIPTPELDTSLLPECAPCETNEQCAQGRCWGTPKKCTDYSWKSLKKCFQKECGRCRWDEQCSTRRCWLGRCAYKSNLSQVRCFPVHMLDRIRNRLAGPK